MEIEDFAEPEIALTAALTAAICSPRVRGIMRKGLVYGIAGVLAAGEVVTSLAKSVGQGVQQASDAAVQEARKTVAQERVEEKREEEKTPVESSEKAVKPAPATRRKTATKTTQAKTPAGAGRQSA
ncbi:MAG TPA: hypothetical protein VF458_21780 [Ktedonobacteraceae bacterium]